jgi:hypothetical protein
MFKASKSYQAIEKFDLDLATLTLRGVAWDSILTAPYPQASFKKAFHSNDRSVDSLIYSSMYQVM